MGNIKCKGQIANRCSWRVEFDYELKKKERKENHIIRWCLVINSVTTQKKGGGVTLRLNSPTRHPKQYPRLELACHKSWYAITTYPDALLFPWIRGHFFPPT